MIIEEICNNFISDKILNISHLGDGHINETFLLETSKDRYVLQRIAANMDISKLEYNYNIYSEAFDKNDLMYPKLIRNREGGFFYTDTAGENWRMYKYIHGDILQGVLAEEIIYEYGKGLANLHRILRNVKAEPKAVFRDLHNLKKYYEKYLEIIRNQKNRSEYRDAHIEEEIEYRYEHINHSTVNPGTVIHGDPKLANTLFKDGHVVGFLDFDTIMCGSVLDDMADCIRSGCIADSKLDETLVRRFIDGYKYSAPAEMKEYIDNNLKEAFDKICLELAIRYYTDVISEGVYFKEKYPGYRMERVKSLIAFISHNERLLECYRNK